MSAIDITVLSLLGLLLLFIIVIFNVGLLFAANMLLCFYRANTLDALLFESK